MYRSVYYGVFAGLVCVVISVKANVEARDCFETVMFNEMCCQFNSTDEMGATMEECAKSTMDTNPRSCALETCFAQKAGYLFPNGTIDMTVVATIVENDFESYSDVKDIVMEKCVKADNLNIYGSPGMCQAKKILNCIRLHALLNCPQWEDSENCNKVKDKIAECESVYP